jgi:hypothetical protein
MRLWAHAHGLAAGCGPAARARGFTRDGAVRGAARPRAHAEAGPPAYAERAPQAAPVRVRSHRLGARPREPRSAARAARSTCRGRGRWGRVGGAGRGRSANATRRCVARWVSGCARGRGLNSAGACLRSARPPPSAPAAARQHWTAGAPRPGRGVADGRRAAASWRRRPRGSMPGDGRCARAMAWGHGWGAGAAGARAARGARTLPRPHRRRTPRAPPAAAAAAPRPNLPIAPGSWAPQQTPHPPTRSTTRPDRAQARARRGTKRRARAACH